MGRLFCPTTQDYRVRSSSLSLVTLTLTVPSTVSFSSLTSPLIEYLSSP